VSSLEPAVLATRNLAVAYGRRKAVDDVSLSVEKGSVYALLGRNGAGKSSLVRCLLGHRKPDAGEAILFGEDVWKKRARLLSRVGVVPEEPDAPPDMTAESLGAFSSRLFSRWDSTGYGDRLTRFAIPRPDLLVLDDPTLGLDAVARKAVFEELVEELAERGTTVFLTTHDLHGVERMADRVGILKDGKLVLDESLETIKSRFRKIRYANEATETRAEYGRELEGFFALKVKVRGWGVEAVVSNYDDVAFERLRQTDGVVEVESDAMSLEEIFLAVAGEETKETKEAKEKVR
jgi:ABC-2 type transport system ATP-binding protein